MVPWQAKRRCFPRATVSCDFAMELVPCDSCSKGSGSGRFIVPCFPGTGPWEDVSRGAAL